jgi:hypothetical protein
MNELIETLRRVVIRKLTITTIETWTISIRWREAEASCEEEQSKNAHVDQISQESIKQKDQR